MERLKYKLDNDHSWQELTLLQKPELPVIMPLNNGYGLVVYDFNCDNCYSTGLVTAPPADPLVGGFIGSVVGAFDVYSVTDSFWDTETSGMIVSPGGGTGESTSNMKTKSMFTGVGWEFITIWDKYEHCNDGYPCLRKVTPHCDAGGCCGNLPVKVLVGEVI